VSWTDFVVTAIGIVISDGDEVRIEGLRLRETFVENIDSFGVRHSNFILN
jgi:hypothetical protein